MGSAQYSDLMPQHQELGVLEADDRPSRTSRPQSRTKMRQSSGETRMIMMPYD
jgi:hypothetical protein